MNTISRIAALAVVAGMLPANLSAQEIEINEWVVPWDESRPRDPYVHSDGTVWFVGQRSDYAAQFNPETKKFKRFDLGEGVGPHNLIVAPDGIVWFAGNRQGFIGKLDPSDGSIEKIQMPDPAARDPHTLIFDSNGDIWFTVQGGGFVGHLAVDDESVKLMKVPTAGARPYGIVLDGTDRPWIALFGTHKLATVDPTTMQLREIPLPREEARPRRIGLTPDQKIWYVDYAGGFLGRFDPETEAFTEWPMPSGSSARPYGMSVDGEGRVWFVETGVQPNRFVGFNPATEEFFSSTEVGSGGGTIRHMFFHAPKNEIWFGADSNTIGRAKVGTEPGT
ncbi:MAG: lyase [Rhodothermales bacterium]